VRGKHAVAVLGAVAALVVVAGCGGRPPGVDGNLTNNWPAMPDAKLPVPADHACYALSAPALGLVKLPPPLVDCGAQHNLETIHVAVLTGDDAKADAPPPDGSPVQQHADTDFAGVWEAPPGAYPADAGERDKIRLDGCRGVIASFAGIPNDDNLRYRVGLITYSFGKAEWDLGNRGVHCFIWMGNKTFTKSLKGAGTADLPINYE
jgi:hypothetical protein